MMTQAAVLQILENGSFFRSKMRSVRCVAFTGLTLSLVFSGGAAGVLPGSVAAMAQEKPAIHYTTKHIYSETADPNADIAAALIQARKEHKRVLLDFGGDWCGDCQVLDIYFHQAPNDELLSKNYVLVHVWIGRMDRNLEIPEKYGVPIKKGVPALAVLDAKGSVLYSQKTGEFEDMRHMDTSSVTDFLEKWKRT
jgi:thiol:disulfide interchange protein